MPTKGWRKHVYAEVPPRTEYSLTAYGESLSAIIDRIQELEAELGEGAQQSP